MISKEEILKILKEIIHPEEKKNIVALNIVKDIIIENNQIIITLFFKKAKDPFAKSIKNNCIKEIKEKLKTPYEIVFKEEYPVKNSETEYSTISNIKNIIAVASGKGGVGKSTVAANLSIALTHLQYKVGLLDADIFGPSIPIMFGLTNHHPTMMIENGKEYIEPVEKYLIKIQSAGFFFNPENALIWRGPMASNALKQIIFQTYWGDLDFLVIDLPPGTSDIHLTIVQEIPVTGAIIVSTPQNVALTDVIKAINMFKNDKINVPILGLVENMAWFTPLELPDNKYYIFGKEGCKRLSEKQSIPLLGQIPIVQSICDSGDNGKPAAVNPFSIEGKAFAELAEKVVIEVDKRNRLIPPTKKVEVN